MLYVFHVDVGRMMNFDMTVALSSVDNLKETIERLHGITAGNIVLLVSGGEMLAHCTQVAYYSAGTDTNPIYMFLNGDNRLPPSAIPQTDAIELDLAAQVERALELPAIYETVVTRAKLAQRMYDMARDEERICERLVHEQHLQQQGWYAVVANLEDLIDVFKLRYSSFSGTFVKHLDMVDTYLYLLRNFPRDMMILEHIPILPCLMRLAEEDFHGFDVFFENTDDEVFSRSSAQKESVLVAGGKTVAAALEPSSSKQEDNATTSATGEAEKGSVPAAAAATSSSQTSATSNSRLSLLQWITSKENRNSLQRMSDECIQSLGTFTQIVFDKIKGDVEHCIKMAEMPHVREIKGLSDRLCKLEEMKYRVKALVQDQKELSTAFQQNQNRAINLRDASILPDLCASHKSQMSVMLTNHQKIRELRRNISKAKEELGNNLHSRLGHIIHIENAMSEFDSNMLFYHRCIRRTERHIHILDQIHQAPGIYVAAVTEVVRRKIFSGEFRMWASKLAEDFDVIHSEEMNRRKNFNLSFSGHFLNILFPGMNDMPPAFANENPLNFDALLPNITKSDVDMLSSHLPDTATPIQLPDMGHVINFFVLRSGAHQRDRIEELLKQQVSAALDIAVENATPSLQNQRLGELQKTEVGGGCDESETDTETEFEKVPASAAEGASVEAMVTSTNEKLQPTETAMRSASTATEQLLMLSAATITEETEVSARAEVERLRGILAGMSQLSTDCIRLARANLASQRSDEIAREELQSELKMIKDKWNELSEHCIGREQQLQASIDDRDIKYEDIKQQLDSLSARSSDRIKSLQLNCCALETEVDKLNQQLKAMELEKSEAVALASEELIHEHKTEIESLRCRFKLMTSMDLSPSEGSLLENFERPTSACSDQSLFEKMAQQHEIELAQLTQQHESALAQMAQQHEAALNLLRANLDVEKAAAICAAVESERFLWQSKIFPLNSESVMANVSILKAMLEDRERQLEQLREKDVMNTKDLIETRTRLSTLTQEDASSWLKEKIEYLTNDKSRLEQELNMEKSRRAEMESSFAALKSSTYQQQVTLPRSRSSGSSHRYIVLESCGKDDIVFVVWSMRHGQFMVVQDSSSLYFVHGDSLTGLNLHLPPTPPTQAVGGDVAIANVVVDDLTVPMPYYAIGRVIEKEYCQARKDENRYRVNKGSKFYRIKVAPLTSKLSTRRERLESLSTSIHSRSILHSDPHITENTTSVIATLATGTPIASSSSEQQFRQQQQQQLQQISASAVWSTAVKEDVVDSVVAAAAILPAPSNVSAVTAVAATAVTAATVVVGSPGGAVNVSDMQMGGGGGGFKERTISFTTVSEEDDEPISMLSELCRYISLSEEEEPLTMITATDAVAPITITETTTSAGVAVERTATIQPLEEQLPLLQRQSVITEQPTASSKLKLDFLLASADIITPQLHQNVAITQAETIVVITTTTTASSSIATNTSTFCTSTTAAAPLSCPNSNICSPTPTPPSQAADTAESVALASGSVPAPLSVSVSAFTNAAIQRFIGQSDNAEFSTSSFSPIPPSLGNASEDSEEYRSLEAKDEEEDDVDIDKFPISEF